MPLTLESFRIPSQYKSSRPVKTKSPITKQKPFPGPLPVLVCFIPTNGRDDCGDHKAH